MVQYKTTIRLSDFGQPHLFPRFEGTVLTILSANPVSKLSNGGLNEAIQKVNEAIKKLEVRMVDADTFVELLHQLHPEWTIIVESDRSYEVMPDFIFKEGNNPEFILQ